jgi:POT family proton-dependent oligopeptide transporter
MDEKKDVELETIRNDRAFLGHPKGVGALAFGNFANSAAWGAFYAVMIYYLYTPYTRGLGFTEGDAAQMVTAMGAANGLFVILGSWLADRVLGMRKSLIIGNLVKETGFLLLAIPAVNLTQGRVFAFLSLFLLALPIMGASNASLTGQMYAKKDNGRRDAAFTIHQVANTIAGLVTPLIVAQLGLKNYHLGFGVAAFFAFVYGAIIFFTQHKFFGPLGEKPIKPLPKGEFKKFAGIFVIILVVAIAIVAGLILKNVMGLQGFLNILTTFTFIIPIVFIANLFRAKDLTDTDRRHLRPFLKMFGAQIVVGLGGTLLTTAIAVFLDKKIDRHIFGFVLAPGAIPTIYTVLGLIAGPVCIFLWTKTRAANIPTIKKYCLGLFTTAMGFGLLAIPTLLLPGNGGYSLWWMVGYYIFMALSDQFIWPIGSSVVSKLSPAAYETQMQTAWGQASAIANGIALILFRFFNTADQQVYLFPIMAGLLIICLIFLLVNSKSIEREMA